MVYLILFLLVFILIMKFDFLQGNEIVNITSTYKNWSIFIVFALTIVAGLAYSQGSDIPIYVASYTNASKLSNFSFLQIDGRFQPGWQLLESFFRTISPNFLIFQFFHALFVNIIFLRFVYRRTSNFFFVVLAFLFVNYLEFNYEILRESLAVCFSLLAFESLENKKYLRVLIFLFLAFEMHISGLFAIVVLLCSRLKITNTTIIVALIICVASQSVLFSIPDINLYIAFLDQDTIQNYYSNSYSINDDRMLNIFGLIVSYLKYLTIPVLAYLTNRKTPNKYLILAFIFACLRIISVQSYAFYRLTNYLSVFYFIVFAEFVDFLLKKFNFNKMLTMTLVVVYLYVVFDSHMTRFERDLGHYYYERYFPYESVLEQNKSYLNYIYR